MPVNPVKAAIRRMAATLDPRHAKIIAIGTSLLLLIAFGCSSGAKLVQEAVPTASFSAASGTQLTQPTQTETATVNVSPAPQKQTSTPSVSSAQDAARTSPPSPNPSPTPSPTSSPTPSPTSSPTPAPTPALTQLTSGGCCTQPFWSPDSTWVLFIDKPAPDAPTAIWGVNTTEPGSVPELLTERIAPYTGELTLVVEYGGGETAIERLDGPLSDTVVERWTVPAGGRSISISPGRSRIAWGVSNDSAPFERRVTEVWIANLDGSDARAVATLPRGDLSGWVSDDVLLLTRRESLQSRETIVYTYSLVDGGTAELVRAERPRGYRLSPDRRWMIYFQSFSEDAADNGLWLVRTDGSQRRQLDRALFGDYAWRDEGRLLIIPFQPHAAHHELWQYDVETGQASRLTVPADTSFKIANGDWSLSPDGQKVAFVESNDRNIWLLTLVE